MIKSGAQNISSLYLGAEEVKKAYLGEEVVFAVSKPSRLPEGYTEVQYIESSGGPYINTGFKPTKTIKLTMDVAPTTEGTSTTKYFAYSSYSMALNGTTNYVFGLSWYTGAIRAYAGSFVFKSGVSSQTVPIYDLSTDTTLRRMILTLDYTSKLASIKGETEIVLSSNATSTSMSKINLFRNSSIKNAVDARLYSCQIESAGELVRNFVPCVDPSGAVGLYDMVNGQFYGNAASAGTFAAGPVV